MTLLPIIYTSLLIFSALLFSVILISYVSFKMKRVTQTPGHLVRHSPQPLVPLNQIRTIPRIEVPIPRNISRRESEPISINQRDISVNRNSVDRNRLASTHFEKPIQILQHSSSDRYKYEDYYRNKDRSRIEIMNTSEKYHFPQRFSDPVVHEKISAQNLTDMNFLNFYSDRNDPGFVSLTAF